MTFHAWLAGHVFVRAISERADPVQIGSGLTDAA
jgi:hypothetical protein